MPVTNYKNELRKMKKEDIIKFIEVNGHLAEMFELASADCVANTNNGANGVDGFDRDTGRPVEIKTQIYKGNFTLRGRGKYGSVNPALLAKKRAVNERVIVSGSCAHTGEVYYRFSFDFDAIAPRYAEVVEVSADKQWGNCDVYPQHYMNHPSFEVEYVAPPVVLESNQDKFMKKFYGMVHKLSSTGELDKKGYAKG